MQIPTIAWPLATLGFAGFALAITALIFVYTQFKQNLLQQAEADRNYYVLTDVIASSNEEITAEISKLTQRYNRLLKFGAGFFVAALVLAALLAGRPSEIKVTSEEMRARDIMLCLDVSGSTLLYDREILESFKQVAQSFEGERIGFSIFNSTSRTVFPLTDDYSLIQNQLDLSIAALRPIRQDTQLDAIPKSDAENLLYFLAGTTSKTDSASLIGDGLANCALQFDDLSQDRPRSIIFSTDNILSGQPLYSLEEAATFAQNRNIKLYSIYSGPSNLQGQENEENMKNTTTAHGGLYFFAKSPSVLNSVVSEIGKEYQEELNPTQNTVIIDDTTIVLTLLLLAFGGYLIVSWRLRQ